MATRGRISRSAAFSTIMGAGAGLVTNVLTSGWNWPLGIFLIVLVGAWTAAESWQRAEPGFALPAAPASEVRTLGASIVPPLGLLPREVHGRSDLLGMLTSLITAPDGHAHVLAGMGGAGKTTVALKVAAIAATTGVKTWWIDASTAESTLANVGELLLELGAAPRDVEPVPEERRALVDTLWAYLDEATKPWLLVVDNADEPDFLAADRSQAHRGNGLVRGSAKGLVVVTSRVGAAEAWGTTCVLHEVLSLSPAEGARILIDAVGDRAGGVEDASVLAGLLAGVPLAIRGAARYLASSAAALDGIKTFHAYGEALESRFLALLEASPVSTSPRDSVLLTWEISLDRLERHGMRDARSRRR